MEVFVDLACGFSTRAGRQFGELIELSDSDVNPAGSPHA
jgi:hypothetical protein